MKKSHSVLGILLLLAPVTGRGQTNETPQAYSLSGKPLFSPVPDAKAFEEKR